MNKKFQRCNRTVLDTTIPGIQFDSNGICQFVKVYEEMDKLYPLYNAEQRLSELVQKIKNDSKGKKYDCIVGVSGGTDSTFMLYQAVKKGLRPLAVHFDNGWNSKIAVKNIRNACEKLSVDLYTYVVDWEEFKDLQISFLKASVSDAEIPTDVGIHGTVMRVAAKEGVKYVLNGHSFRTEFIMPIGWTYMDGKYINSVHKQFGNIPLKTFPNFTLTDYVYYHLIRGIKQVPFLNYFDYDKAKAKELLVKELGWEYSGGHHHESTYTKFFQSYLLPQKFKIDKRKTELTAMILSGHINRNQALEELNSPYPYEPEIVDYTINKLGLTKPEFEEIMKLPVKHFYDYSTYFPLIKAMKIPVKIATNMGLLPKIIYYKFLET
jgi:N-acetyl sugar amidotransferase